MFHSSSSAFSVSRIFHQTDETEKIKSFSIQRGKLMRVKEERIGGGFSQGKKKLMRTNYIQNIMRIKKLAASSSSLQNFRSEMSFKRRITSTFIINTDSKFQNSH